MKKFSILKIRKNLTQNDVANALYNVSKSNSQNVLIATSRDLLCDVIYELKNGQINCKEVLDTWLKHGDILPPLELLWILEEEKLLKITTFLYFHPEYCDTINNFLSISLGAQDVNETEQCLTKKILSTIIANILKLKNNNDFKFLYEEIIHNFVSEAVINFHFASLDWNYFHDLKDNGMVNDVLEDFSLLHLEKFLNSDGDENNIAFVIGNHTKLWSSGKLSEQATSFIIGFTSVLNPQTVLTEINNVVLQGAGFSWKGVLLVISIFVQEQNNAELMKGKVDRWLVSAIEEKDKSLLYISLIVARHCCHEKARYFVNYPTWFGSLSLKTVASFTFFFDCLSQIVPDEPPLYLKIQINKVPSAPTSCQRKILDYLALAKTRLSDLNETTDYIGLFNDYHETDEGGQESDVQRAIKLYQETKEIPKALLEASVFRRQYYEKTFLKRLLSLSQNEDEQRAELIKKLYSTGKIPSTLYRSWSSRSLAFT